jgi:RNA polymerase sigma factor FliA
MMNMTLAELRETEHEIRRSDLTSLSSLAVTAGDGRIELIETIQAEDPEADPERQAAREEARAKFRRAFERLSAREREVAVLLYVQNLTLREIGEVLEVSESRVSQIHSQLKKRIREGLTNDSGLFGELAS